MDYHLKYAGIFHNEIKTSFDFKSNQNKTMISKQDIMKDYATLRPVSKSMKNLMDAKISIF